MTAVLAIVLWTNGTVAFFWLFWTKVATMTLTYYFINVYNEDEYYYYQNLGLSKRRLWTVTLSFDFLIFLFTVYQTFRLR